MGENNIILEFPLTNQEIGLGETLTFDNVSGFLPLSRTIGDLPLDRLEGIDGILSTQDGHDIWNNP